ncbi:hypothetical protein Tco_0609143 [Tanacetum coccineum]
MSDSEDSTVTYTEKPSPYEEPSDMGSPGVKGPIFQDPPSLDYVPGPEEPEQAPPSPIYPLPVAASPTTESPGYIPESDPKEDLEEDDEEDPADYPADRGDDRDDEEPSNDDDDDDDDAEEEEHLAPSDPVAVAYSADQDPYLAYRVTARMSIRPQGRPAPFLIHIQIVALVVVMSTDYAVTYTSVHSEARSWSIPFEDPYEEAARQLFEQAPHSPDHKADESYSTIHLSFTTPIRNPTIVTFPLPTSSTSRKADIPEADTPPQKRLLFTTPRSSGKVGESSTAAAARRPGPTIETRLRDTKRRMMTALELVNKRVTYQVLRRERLAYEQESVQTRQDLARSEAHCRALEARLTVLETEACRHEWQRQAADDLVVQHIMHTQALEAGARVDTLEDTGSSS